MGLLFRSPAPTVFAVALKVDYDDLAAQQQTSKVFWAYQTFIISQCLEDVWFDPNLAVLLSDISHGQLHSTLHPRLW